MEEQVVEKRGKNVDEAIKAALDELGCEIDDVVVEVIKSLPGVFWDLWVKSPQWSGYLNERNREKMYARF